MPYVPLSSQRTGATRAVRQLDASEHRRLPRSGDHRVARSIGIMAAAGVIIAALTFVFISPTFRVQRLVIVTPGDTFPASEAELLLGDFLGRHMFFLDETDAENLLRASFPNLRRVTLEPVLPSLLRAKLEAWPAAIRVAHAGETLLVSTQGLRIQYPSVGTGGDAGSGAAATPPPAATPDAGSGETLLDVTLPEGWALPEDPSAPVFPPEQIRAWVKFRDDLAFRTSLQIVRVLPRGGSVSFLTAEGQEILVMPDADLGRVAQKLIALFEAKASTPFRRLDLRIPGRVYWQ